MKKECKNPVLSNGDTIGDVVSQEAMNHLAHSAAVAAGLDKGLDTHVKRDSTGAVQTGSYNQVVNDELTAHKMIIRWIRHQTM